MWNNCVRSSGIEIPRFDYAIYLERTVWQLLIPSYTDLRHHDVSLMEMKHRDVEELCEM